MKRQVLRWVYLPRDLLPQVWSADRAHCHHLEQQLPTGGSERLAWESGRVSGLAPGLVNQSLYFNKVSRWFVCMDPGQSPVVVCSVEAGLLPLAGSRGGKRRVWGRRAHGSKGWAFHASGTPLFPIIAVWPHPTARGGC